MIPEDVDLTHYDPAVDRTITRDEKGRWVLTLGFECNSPLYALTNLAQAIAWEKPKTWRHRVSWTFRFPTGRDTDRLVVKPLYAWDDVDRDPDLALLVAGWYERGYRLHLNRWHPGPLTIDGREYPDGVQVVSSGRITFAEWTVYLSSPESFIVDDLTVVAELLETLQTDPATVYARARGHCCFCGKKLTDPVSQRVGYGPDCAEKLQLAHGAKAGLDLR